MKCPACKWAPPVFADDTCELCGLRGEAPAWKVVLFLAWAVPVTLFALLYVGDWAERWFCPTCQRTRSENARGACICGEEGGPVPALGR